MRVRNGTSLDAKMARNALMKQLAELPISTKPGAISSTARRKAAIAKAPMAVAPSAKVEAKA